jgi:uncharacterized protein
MIDYNRLLELHGLACREAANLKIRRGLFDVLQADSGRHLNGIAGPRGAGKTVILKQIAASEMDAFYLSTDTLPSATDLFEIIKRLSEKFRFRRFLLDEIHFLPQAMGDLKKIHDFLPEVRVVFTSSVALAIHSSGYDLARRVVLHSLGYFSFREYLAIRRGESLQRIAFNELLAGEFDSAHLRASRFFSEYLLGGELPYAMEEPNPLPLLGATIEKVIHRDIPATLRLHTGELSIIEKLVAFVGRAGIDGINYSSLSQNLGITKYKAEQYVAALEAAFLLKRVFPAGTNVLREPKVLLMPPLRLLHRTTLEAMGGLREDYFAMAMTQAGMDFQYLKSTTGRKTPDFLVEHGGQKIAMEIGGKGKGRSQFKGVQTVRKIILAPDVAPSRDKIPLHLLGFLA